MSSASRSPVVIVTGTSRGLGAAFVDVLLAKRSAHVVAVARRFTDAQRAAASRGELDLVELDLSDLERVAGALDLPTMRAALSSAQRVVFVSNAAVVEPIGRLADASPDALRAAAAVNFVAPAMLVAGLAAWAGASPERTLRVVEISSGAATRPIPGWAAYCATKAATRMFVSSHASETEPHVSVRVVDPGVLDTDMQRSARTADPARFPDAPRFAALHADGKLAPPHEVASRILVEEGLA